MMKIKLIQENPVVGDILGNLAKAKEEIDIAKKNNVNLIIFSEMFLCGYPPEDLVLRSDFINKIDDILIVLPWIIMYIVAWHFQKQIDQ